MGIGTHLKAATCGKRRVRSLAERLLSDDVDVAHETKSKSKDVHG